MPVLVFLEIWLPDPEYCIGLGAVETLDLRKIGESLAKSLDRPIKPINLGVEVAPIWKRSQGIKV